MPRSKGSPGAGWVRKNARMVSRKRSRRSRPTSIRLTMSTHLPRIAGISRACWRCALWKRRWGAQEVKLAREQRICVTVNGKVYERTVPFRLSLADFLREHLHLTGTHLGCEHGVCGACTVMIDGAPARSCITLAVACDGADIRTVESFDDDPVMAQLRAAFTAEHALQCGFCTPGMLATAHDIVTRLPD